MKVLLRKRGKPVAEAAERPHFSISSADVTEIARESRTIHEFFAALIARAEGIRPEDVTIEYIHEQRELRVYPQARPSIGSRYGGYGLRDMEIYTREELDAVRDRVDSELDKLGV
jgi:hypothetical protein